MSVETHTTFCRICEALCGLEVDVEDGAIVDVRPDDKHVSTGGYACVKGLRQHEIFGSGDRLKYPLKKVGDEHVRISWEQALSEIGAKVAAQRAIHPDRIAMYVGTAAGFGVLHPVFAQGFMTAVGSKSMFSSATQDCANKFATARHLYGFPFTQPFPDLEHTECLIVVGANPAISKWSFLQVSNPIERLRSIERRGGDVFFVDPRRTESAKVAGEHLPIRPGTDVFFYLSFLHLVLEAHAQSGDVIDETRVGRFMRNRQKLDAIAKSWSPERTAEVTKIPAPDLRRLVRRYLKASKGGGAALYSSTGVNMGGQGALCFWLQEVIGAITGNLDRKGGTLVGEGVIDFPAFGKRTGALLRTDRSRIGAFVSNNDTFPGGILADEIFTPGPRQIRSLFVTGGNPLLTMAGSARLRDAFRSLECLVVLDIFPSETAQEADYVLPCTSPLQRPDLPFVFPLMLGLQSKPYLQATEALLPLEGEQRDEASIYFALCQAAGLPFFGSKIAHAAVKGVSKLSALTSGGDGIPQRWLLDMLLRATGQGSFKSLLDQEHGRRRKGHRPGSFLGERVVTDDGLVDLAPDALVSELEPLERLFELELASADELRLITKRQVKTHNSWTHNHPAFSKQQTNHLYMHSEDLRARTLSDGDFVDVTSATATVRVPVKRSDDLMVGSVALPHGWGHQHAKGLSVASKTRGVNVNLLAADGPDALERVSGMARLTGIPVTVVTAAGPQHATWSGLPEDGPRRLSVVD
ncbi:MAG: anaerobic selenocysteine-containing dehydrogenase [Polyangiales bacterium]|jgi:anaerobic selenocysteine-containing dehydrogenase